MTTETKMIKHTSNVQNLISKFDKINASSTCTAVKSIEIKELPVVKRRYSPVPCPIITSGAMINQITLDTIKLKKQLTIFNSILETNGSSDDIAFINSIVNIIISKNNCIIANNNKLKGFVYSSASIEILEERNDCYRLDNDILLCYVDSISM
jgi:hypothetical protein